MRQVITDTYFKIIIIHETSYQSQKVKNKNYTRDILSLVNF